MGGMEVRKRREAGYERMECDGVDKEWGESEGVIKKRGGGEGWMSSRNEGITNAGSERVDKVCPNN